MGDNSEVSITCKCGARISLKLEEDTESEAYTPDEFVEKYYTVDSRFRKRVYVIEREVLTHYEGVVGEIDWDDYKKDFRDAIEKRGGNISCTYSGCIIYQRVERK